MCDTSAVARRAIAVLLVVSQLVLLQSGCLSVQATRSAGPPGPDGGVSVRVYADDSARRARRPGPQGIFSELDRKEQGRWVPRFRSIDPSWAVAGLPAGAYRLRFPARLDEGGNVVRLSGDTTALQVEDGKVTEVQAVLEHISPALVILGVITVVVVAVLLVDWLKDHDLPEPPLPPPEVVEAIYYVTVNLGGGAGWQGVSDPHPPAVTSHFPAAGAIVAARRPRAIFAMSEALQPGELEADGITVLGEATGIVAGQVSYDGEHWWVVWEPREDMARGDTFHVTLAADAVEDRSGNELTAPVTFVFRSAD